MILAGLQRAMPVLLHYSLAMKELKHAMAMDHEILQRSAIEIQNTSLRAR